MQEEIPKKSFRELIQETKDNLPEEMKKIEKELQRKANADAVKQKTQEKKNKSVEIKENNIEEKIKKHKLKKVGFFRKGLCHFGNYMGARWNTVGWRFYDKGIKLIETGKVEKGIGNLEKAISLCPTSDRLLDLGKAYCKIGSYELAYAVFERMVKDNEISNGSNFIYACSELNNQEQIVDLLKKLAEHKNSNDAWYEVGIEFVKMEESYEAVSAFIKAIEQDNFYSGYREKYITALLDVCRNNDQEKIIFVFKNAANNVKDERGLIWSTLGELCFEFEDYQNSIESFETAIESDPKAVYFNHLCDIYLDKFGDLKKAAEVAQKALQEADFKENNCYVPKFLEIIHSYERKINKENSNDELFLE